MTFVATANSVLHVGARPVLVDCDRETMNIDPARGRREDHPPHARHPAGPLRRTPRRHDRARGDRPAARHPSLEDAAHAVEASHQGRKVGTIGDCTVFSFYVTKNVVTGEGGMVTRQDEEIASWIKVAGLHGMRKDAWKRIRRRGLQALRGPLPRLQVQHDRHAGRPRHPPARSGWRRTGGAAGALWRRYMEAFADLPIILPAPIVPGDRHAHASLHA